MKPRDNLYSLTLLAAAFLIVLFAFGFSAWKQGQTAARFPATIHHEMLK